MSEERKSSGARAAHALIQVSRHIDHELERTIPSQWGDIRPRIQALAEGQGAGASEMYDVVEEARRIILEPNWVRYLSHGHSASFVQEFELLARDAARQVSAAIEAAVDEIAPQPVGDQIDRLQRHAIAAGKMVVAPDQVQRVAALLLDEVATPQRTMGGEPHPLLKMGMTYGSRPAKGLASGDDAPVIDVSLEGSKPAEYDLSALLVGAPGTMTSGLGYRLVQALDTIVTGVPGAPVENAPPVARDSGIKYYRQDAPGVTRPIVSDWTLAQVMGGPRDALFQYNQLAGAALGVEGFRTTNPEAVIRGIGQDDVDAVARQGRELYQLDRIPPDDMVERGATTIATMRAQGSRDEIESRHLGRVDQDVAGELALTALLHREWLVSRLTSAMRQYTPGASGQAALRQAMRNMLAEEEASVKTGALLHMN